MSSDALETTFSHHGLIRRATNGDADAIRRVVSHRRAIARAAGGWIDSSWVYEIDGGVLAFATRHGGEVDALYVHPAFRRRDIGRRLLGAMERLIQADGLPGVRLHVEARNSMARQFYEHNGYADSGLRTKDGWTMEKFFDGQPTFEDRQM